MPSGGFAHAQRRFRASGASNYWRAWEDKTVRKVVMITGMQAAGKTTVGSLLASHLTAPAAVFDGDIFYRMVKSGNVDYTPIPSPEALRQVRLRYATAGLVAQNYADNGFDFVYTDIVLGNDVTQWMESLRNVERHLIVLTPSTQVIAGRELARGGGNSYRDWQEPGMTLESAIRKMQEMLQETPRRGLWINSDGQSPNETVEEILRNDMKASLY